ncbi:MAG: hypothetical protein WBO25_01785 [Acidimicrobiia bacterium]
MEQCNAARLRRSKEVREPVTSRRQHRRHLVPLHPILAHQYGWDEALLFVVPIVIAVVVVRRLDKRSRREERPPSEED